MPVMITPFMRWSEPRVDNGTSHMVTVERILKPRMAGTLFPAVITDMSMELERKAQTVKFMWGG